jgi:hypothetical protein
VDLDHQGEVVEDHGRLVVGHIEVLDHPRTRGDQLLEGAAGVLGQ